MCEIKVLKAVMKRIFSEMTEILTRHWSLHLFPKKDYKLRDAPISNSAVSA